MDDLGNKRPMELLTEMMELVKPGEEKTQLFAMLFMRRLPAQVRVQLTEDDHSDLRALALKADRCAATLAHKATAFAVAAVSDSAEDPDGDFAVAAVSGAQRGARGKRGGYWQRQKQQRQKKPSDGDAPSEVARQASGLCPAHFRYGNRAHSCQKPCAWQEN